MQVWLAFAEVCAKKPTSGVRSQLVVVTVFFFEADYVFLCVTVQFGK